MTNRRIVAVLAVLAVLVAALWWWRRGEGESARKSEVADRAGGTASRRDKNASIIDYQPARVTGRVVAAATGQPMPGATVSVGQLGLDFGARTAPGQSADPLVVATDARGEFTFEGLPPGRWSASATAEGHRPATVEPILLGPGEHKAGLELRLAVGGSRLSGTVTDIGGGPVAGAVVSAVRMSEFSIGAVFRAPYATRTGPDGRYALDLIDGVYGMGVRHPDYVHDNGSITIRGPQTKDFVLTPGGVIEGVVLSRGDDKPVAGALVSQMSGGDGGGFVLSGVGFGGAVTDAEGKFALRGLGAGAINLRAMAPGLASAEATTVELGIAEQRSDVVLYVEKAYSISGTVVASGDKKALPGALVGAYAFQPPSAYVASDPSADDGSFVIHGVRPGSYSIGAAIDQRVPSFVSQGITISDKDLDGIVIELDAGAVLRGRVEPATAASVHLEFDGEVSFGNMLQVAASALVSARADDAGVFELRGAPSGRFKLVATADDGSAGELKLEVKGDQDGIVVALEPRGVIAGVVVDDGGQPVAGVEVDIETQGDEQGKFRMNFGGGQGADVTTGPDGRFEARGLADGTHEIKVDDDGQLTWAGKKGDAAREPVEVVIKAAQQVRDVRLVVESRREVLRGIVLAADGTPAVDAWVTATFIPADGVTPWGGKLDDDDGGDDDKSRAERKKRQKQMRRWYPSQDPVLTDAGGRFEVKNLRRGSYDLSAQLPGDGARGDLEAVASGSNVTIKLDPQGVLIGKVSKAGAPVTSFVVKLDGPSARTQQFGNPEGSYRMGRLKPGEYEVSVQSPAGRTMAKATVAAGGEQTVDLQLMPYGSVRGVVVDAATAKPIAGLRVFAFGRGGEDGDFAAQAMGALSDTGPRTDAEGRFRIDGLSAGPGNVMVLAEEGMFEQVATKEYSLEPGQDLDVGTLQGTQTASVPEDQRGWLGFEATQATWRRRPAKTGGDEPPAGMEPTTVHLWVDELDPAGPAAKAGVAAGDRIATINGVAVEAVGPPVARRLLSDRSVQRGASVTLGLVRGTAPPTSVTVTAVARPAKSE